MKFFEWVFWFGTGVGIAWVGFRHNATSLMILGAVVIACALWPLVPKNSDDLHIKP